MTPQKATLDSMRTLPDSYPIDVSQLSFNFLCLLLLYSIYLNGTYSFYRLLTKNVSYIDF